eukprot:scaffold2261_cov231-Pinguiococcus_pyrenoidosus.AAC.3
MDDAKHREIYTFEAPWTIYAMGWSQKVDSAASFRLALGSFIEEYSNKVLLIQQDTNGDFHDIGQFDHPYPATKVGLARASFASKRVWRLLQAFICEAKLDFPASPQNLRSWAQGSCGAATREERGGKTALRTSRQKHQRRMRESDLKRHRCSGVQMARVVTKICWRRLATICACGMCPRAVPTA